MLYEFSIIWMAVLIGCYGVTLQTLWKENTERVVAVAKWSQWTAFAIAAFGFWGPLPAIPAVVFAGCSVTALYFAYHQNQFGMFLAAVLGLIATLTTTVVELVIANQY